MELPDFLRCFARIRRAVARVDAPVKRIMAIRRRDPFKIAVGTVLSARTRDDRLLPVLKELFRAAKTPRDILRIRDDRLQKLLRPLGFFRMKTKILKNFARTLWRDFAGKVPRSMSDLLTLPGVGIKVAAIIRIEAFGEDEISVDIHVHRIMNRLGFVETRTPEKTCAELYRRLPRPIWKHVNVTLVAFGQTTCLPVRPRCSRCPVSSECPRVGVSD